MGYKSVDSVTPSLSKKLRKISSCIMDLSYGRSKYQKWTDNYYQIRQTHFLAHPLRKLMPLFKPQSQQIFFKLGPYTVKNMNLQYLSHNSTLLLFLFSSRKIDDFQNKILSRKILQAISTLDLFSVARF